MPVRSVEFLRVLRARPVGLALGAALALAPVWPVCAQTPPATPPAAPARTAPAPGQVLSLQEAVTLALRQHPTVAASQQTQTAAQARIGEAFSAYYPRVDWLTSAGRSQTSGTTLNAPITGNSISTAIQGTMILYDFGKTGSLVDQARGNARFSTLDVERTRQLISQNVKTAYFQLLQARRLVAVADAALARSQLNLRSAQGFYDVGTKPKSDVTKAEVEVANARVAQIQARNQVRLSETTLSNALGLEATTTVDIQDILTYQPVTLDPLALLAEALANRPELKQNQALIDVARAQLSGARANFLPTLGASASYGGSSSDPALHEQWSIVGTLSWNLFQGFNTVNQVRETQALVEVARANYDTQELQVRVDVEQAYINVVNAAEQIVANEKALESAQELLRLAQGRYDAGVGTILDLTDAQLALTTAEATQVQALTAHKLGLAALDRAVGRP